MTSLYYIEKDLIPKTVIVNTNKRKNWKYGYQEKYDMIVISQDGTLGEVYNIQGLRVGLPAVPKNLKKEEQYLNGTGETMALNLVG